MRVWIVLPAFNEAENLPEIFESVATVLAQARLQFSILVVDDGSVDATRAVLERYATRLPLVFVTHERNRGLARTIETGITAVLREATDDDIVVTMDADNTHPPQLIPRMVQVVRAGTDLVIASRYAVGGAEKGVPLMRRFLSKGIGILLKLRFGLRGICDYSSGYRAYRVSLLRRAIQHYDSRLIEARGFAVMAELLVKLQAFGPRVAEVPLHLRYDRKRGASKLRLVHTVGDYLILLLARYSRVV